MTNKDYKEWSTQFREPTREEKREQFAEEYGVSLKALEFLKDLREEDIDDLKNALKFYNRYKTISKFMLWFWAAIFATVASLITIGEWFVKIKAFLIRIIG